MNRSRSTRIHGAGRALATATALLPLILLCAMLLGVLPAAPAAAQAQPPAPPLPTPWPPDFPDEPCCVPPWPEPVPPPQPLPVALVEHTVDATIDGAVAQVSVSQLFRNNSTQMLEGTYVFPLPPDALPGSLQMEIDGQTVEGKLYDSDEARAIYEEIVRSLRDPALLEFLGNGMFRVSVFPIPAGEERRVELTYEHPVQQEEGLYRFDVPLSAYVPGAGAAESVVVNVELENQDGLRTVYSPTHDVEVERTGDDGALVGFEAAGSRTQGDFTLYWGSDESAIGLNLISYKPTGEDGYFVLLVAPSLAAAEEQIVERDILFVLDVSGSMEGEKIQQARDAAASMLEMLNPGDRFNFITFSTGVRTWENDLQEVNEQTLDDAAAWIEDIDATGSTDINRALLEGLAQLDEETSRPAYMLFMTDGLPTQGETDANRIIENALDARPADRSVRLFTFGVGYDVNTDLLDTLSREMGGRATYVKPEQAIDEVVGDFYAQIGKPVLASVTLDMGDDAVISDLFPYPLPDLFAGEQLVAAGRYREGGDVEVTLEGEINGEVQSYVYEDQVLAERGGEPFVARLWATRKIASLMEQVRRDGPSQELVDAIVELSLDYGIVSPYTSYLVLEPGMEGAAGLPLDPGMTLRDTAAGEAAEAADMAAAAPASGAAAVEASEEVFAMAEAETVAQAETVRYVMGKAFVQRGWVTGPNGDPVPLWVDTSWDEVTPAETIAFGSDEYFALVEDQVVAKWLALSPEMVLVYDGRILRITGADVE